MLVQLQILTVLVVLWLLGKQRSSMVQAFSAENFQAESEEKENDAQSWQEPKSKKKECE